MVIPIVTFRKAGGKARQHYAYLGAFGIDFYIERDGFAVAMPLSVLADVEAAAYLHELSSDGYALSEERDELSVLGYFYVVYLAHGFTVMIEALSICRRP